MKNTRSGQSNHLGITHLRWPLALLLMICVQSLVQADPATHWPEVAERINVQIDRAEQAYASGDTKTARSAVISAYFGEFEDSKMEAALRIEIGAKPTWRLEQQFGQLRKAIKNGVSQEKIAAITTAIRNSMRKSAARLDKAGIPPEVFEVNQ